MVSDKDLFARYNNMFEALPERASYDERVFAGLREVYSFGLRTGLAGYVE